MASLRVVAYNFLSGGSAARTGHWSRIRRHLAPDIVLAQECRAPHETPGERFRAGATDTLLWAPAAPRRWGSAVLLRGQPATPLPIPEYAGWVVGAELAAPAWSPARPVRLFSIHCPVGLRGYIRTLHEILDRIAAWRGGADLILGGDFNVVVGHRQPHERIRMSRGEREILDPVVRGVRPHQLLAGGEPRAPARADPALDRRPPRPLPLRRHLRAVGVGIARLVSCRVVRGSRWAGLSDHNPVVAEFTA